jgi:hypothetical protein
MVIPTRSAQVCHEAAHVFGQTFGFGLGVDPEAEFEDPQAAATQTTTARSTIAPRRSRRGVAPRRWAGTLVLIRRGW